MSRADLDTLSDVVAGAPDAVETDRRADALLEELGQGRLWQDALTEALGISAGARILGLSRGQGELVAVLERAGAQVAMVDLRAGDQAAGGRLGNPAPSIGADPRHLPFPDRVFDGALLPFVGQAVQDLREVLTEIVRVVRPGGCVVVGELSERSVGRRGRGLLGVGHRVGRIARSRPSDDGTTRGRMSSRGSSAAGRSPQELLGTLEAAGLVAPQRRSLIRGHVELYRGVVPHI